MNDFDHEFSNWDKTAIQGNLDPEILLESKETN